MRWLADCFVRFRPLVGAFLVAMTVVATLGYMPKRARSPIPKDFDDSSISDEEQERWRRDEAVTGSFDLGSSEAFLVVECDDLFRAESVRTVRAMVDAVEEMQIVDSVFWLDRMPLLNVFGLADPLLPANDAAAESFPDARERVLHHPLVRGQVLSPDGRTLVMPLVYDWIHLNDEQELTDGVVATARRAIDDELGKLSSAVDKPEFRVRITGDLPLFMAREEAFHRNELMFRTIGYGLAILLAVLMLRGVTAVIIVSAAPMLGVFWSIGLLKLFDAPDNELATVVMPVLVSMIGLTDGIHLLVNIRRRRREGDSPLEASRWTIEHVGVACFLTSLTTAIGFGSLMLADSGFVRDFGRICMYSVIFAFLAVITFIPFVASTWLGKNVHRGGERDLIGTSLLRLDGLLEWILAHRGLVSLVSVAVTIVLACTSLALRPDNRIANQLPSSSEAYQALAHCDGAMGGIQFLQLWISWPESTPNDAPEILAAIRDVEALTAEEPLISFPLSVRNMLASFPGDADDLSTQMTFLSLLPRELRGFFYRPDEREALVVCRVQDQGIAHYSPVFDRIEGRFDGLEDKYEGFEFRLDGGPVGHARELYRIVVDLVKSLGTASAVILIVLTIAFRSIRIGLISVVPNVFPLVATGALLVVMGEPLFIASVCAFTVCLGIAVDDTIHFLSRYRQEQLLGGDVESAVRRTFYSVGTPLVMTTIILVTGFTSVLLSDLPAHRTFAAMACATIGSALIGDLIALPALLAQFAGSSPPHDQQDWRAE